MGASWHPMLQFALGLGAYTLEFVLGVCAYVLEFVLGLCACMLELVLLQCAYILEVVLVYVGFNRLIGCTAERNKPIGQNKQTQY